MMQRLTAEAIDKIDSLATRAAGAKGKLEIVTAPAEPKHVYYTVAHDGTSKKCYADPPPRASTLASINQVVPFIREVLQVADPNAQVVVYVDHDEVVIVCDDANPRDRVTVPLSLHAEYMLLAKIGDSTFTQQELSRLLRIDLVNMRRDSRLLDWLKRVTFSNGTTTTGVAERNRASYGRDVVAEVQSGVAEAAPEFIDLHTRIYSDEAAGDKVSVRVFVEVDVANQRFELRPAPGVLEQEVNRATVGVYDWLSAQLAPQKEPKPMDESVVRPVTVVMGKP